MDNKNVPNSSRRDFIKKSTAAFAGLGMIVAGSGKPISTDFEKRFCTTKTTPALQPKTPLPEWDDKSMGKNIEAWPSMEKSEFLSRLESGDLADAVREQIPKPLPWEEEPIKSLDSNWYVVPMGIVVPINKGAKTTVFIGSTFTPYDPYFKDTWLIYNMDIDEALLQPKRLFAPRVYGLKVEGFYASFQPVRGPQGVFVWTFISQPTDSTLTDPYRYFYDGYAIPFFQFTIDPKIYGKFDPKLVGKPLSRQQENALRKDVIFANIPDLINSIDYYKKYAQVVDNTIGTLTLTNEPSPNLERLPLIECVRSPFGISKPRASLPTTNFPSHSKPTTLQS